jgi:hypothetical protein
MIIRTVLAGNGDHFFNLTRWNEHQRVTAVAALFGARLSVGPGTMEIGNGDISVLLDMTAADEPVDRGSHPQEVLIFSAPVLAAHRLLDGFAIGERIDVYMRSLESRHRMFPWEATEQVMHTKRELHGPGPYPEHTAWGRWINSYRAAASARAEVKAARGT